MDQANFKQRVDVVGIVRFRSLIGGVGDKTSRTIMWCRITSNYAQIDVERFRNRASVLMSATCRRAEVSSITARFRRLLVPGARRAAGCSINPPDAPA